jgi:hypothetical protein
MMLTIFVLLLYKVIMDHMKRIKIDFMTQCFEQSWFAQKNSAPLSLSSIQSIHSRRSFFKCNFLNGGPCQKLTLWKAEQIFASAIPLLRSPTLTSLYFSSCLSKSSYVFFFLFFLSLFSSSCLSKSTYVCF